MISVDNSLIIGIKDSGYTGIQVPCQYNINIVLLNMSGRQLIKLLQEKGWHLDRIEGSHHILIKGNKTLSVPVHGSKDLGKGLLHALMRQGGLK
jgi:predicted RNA binding protein YcfA (HicA-like mRNA interferase family)